MHHSHMSVMHLPDQTRVHQHDHTLCSARSSWSHAPRTPVNCNDVFKSFILAASEYFSRSKSYLEFLSVTSMQCIL